MTQRLETSLRDGRNTMLDEMSRLVPEILPCNLGKLILEDYILDPLVVVEISGDFPERCETDSAWVKTCVLNLVSNAKKHGPTNRPVKIQLIWMSETSTIRVAVTDEGSGLSPARSRIVWRGQAGRQNKGISIGIGAIRSYIDGLGGSYGSENSTFWVQVPGGMTISSFTMSPWTLRFVSAQAEQKFRRMGHKPTTIWNMISR